jgi:hypothetical protein
MLYRGLKSLNELNIIEEIERVAMAKITVSTSDFNFPEISLDPVEVKAF